MCATLLNPNQPNHYFTASPVQARERQIRAPWKCILGNPSRGSYWDHVTVYPYNGYIRSTNPIVRHIMSLTCTLKRILVNSSTPKHAKSKPLHYSNMRAWAPKVWQTCCHRKCFYLLLEVRSANFIATFIVLCTLYICDQTNNNEN